MVVFFILHCINHGQSLDYNFYFSLVLVMDVLW